MTFIRFCIGVFFASFSRKMQRFNVYFLNFSSLVPFHTSNIIIHNSLKLNKITKVNTVRIYYYQNMYSYYSKNAEAYICAVKVKAYISSFKILVALATP